MLANSLHTLVWITAETPLKLSDAQCTCRLQLIYWLCLYFWEHPTVPLTEAAENFSFVKLARQHVKCQA